MSMHKKPLTDLEHAGLEAHGLPIGKPSQLSDCFRSGVAWANERIAELECQVEEAGRYLRDTSRRDKIKQAEELEQSVLHLDSIDGCGITLGLECAANELNSRALELRRQAEELTHDES